MRARGFVLAAAVCAAAFAPTVGTAALGGLIPLSFGTAPAGWWPGDLDLHSTYSPDVCGVPPVLLTTNLTENNCDGDGDGRSASPADMGRTPIELVREAEERRLSFIAITDRDAPATATSPSAQTDEAITEYKRCHVLTPAVCPVLVLDGIEKTLVDKDGFVSGRLTVVGYAPPPPTGPQTSPLGPFPADPTPADGWTTPDLAAAITVLHQPRPDGTPGALVFVDRPASPEFSYDVTAVGVDGWDVWNGSYLDQSEFNGSAGADNPQADAKWMTLQTQLAPSGRRLSMIGSSDARTHAMDLVQGPGQPTLWVNDVVDDPTSSPTWAGIREALVKGRITISSGPPSDGGPLLLLDTADGLYRSGDTVPDKVGRKLRVQWSNAPLGARIRILFNSTSGSISVIQIATATTVDGSSESQTLQFLAGRWYRAEMYVEDLLQPPAAGAPSRSTHGCMFVWPTPNPCLQDRWLMTSIAAPIFAPAA